MIAPVLRPGGLPGAGTRPKKRPPKTYCPNCEMLRRPPSFPWILPLNTFLITLMLLFVAGAALAAPASPAGIAWAVIFAAMDVFCAVVLYMQIAQYQERRLRWSAVVERLTVAPSNRR